ncbi:EAL domain-containing protein (putative c-di-GMP-specific phosphodiesterase class I) [Desulfurispira natronophila]|uniref:EAL domain-containing protein (Putative c-di-GMP-specific phosphodiesterase class I) n=1 Tax=Desulfurispira natronophila TaxID=682562 RepID=A0A7W7Y4Z3_9BACT|nr:EAL domain-containing protein (putative c-di-GMP-specific phosphodiesterase class I) [Desulfurispira natronophila]
MKKKSYCSHIISLAHLLGKSVVAEGVETESELSVCKEMGINLVQGYLIQRPTTAVQEIDVVNAVVQRLQQGDRRQQGDDSVIISRELNAIV